MNKHLFVVGEKVHHVSVYDKNCIGTVIKSSYKNGEWHYRVSWSSGGSTPCKSCHLIHTYYGDFQDKIKDRLG